MREYELEKRRFVIAGLIIVISVLYIVRLFNLQVADETFKKNADSNAFLRKTIYPSRGMIYDRKGRLIVFNQPAYDVMVIPKEIHDLDSLDLCSTLQITLPELRKKFEEMRDTRRNPGYSSFTQQVLIRHLSLEDYGRLQEKLYRFPGFFIQKKTLRKYNSTSGANILGNIREVNQNDIDNDPYYRAGDYTGDLGIEKSYETYLRGKKGQEILIRDAHGRIQGRFENGARDVAPVSGKDLTLSIDYNLQEYGEKLMQGKIGAIVAIEPATGEILALVSSPGYDPSLLIGRDRGKNYRELVNNRYKPLFDRAIMAAYPPGSQFKPTQGLIFLQEGMVGLGTMFPCHRGYINGRLKVGCHGHESPISLKPAIRTSCNAYFCWGFKTMIDKRSKYGTPAKAFEIWKNYLVEMGFGYKLGVDQQQVLQQSVRREPLERQHGHLGGNRTGRDTRHSASDSQLVGNDSQPRLVLHAPRCETHQRHQAARAVHHTPHSAHQQKLLSGHCRGHAHGSGGRHVPPGAVRRHRGVWQDGHGAEPPRTRPLGVYGLRPDEQSQDSHLRLCGECRLRRHLRSAYRRIDDGEIPDGADFAPPAVYRRPHAGVEHDYLQWR